MNIDEFVRNFGVLSGIITIIAIVVSIAVIGVSNSIGKKTLYAKTVSENRVQWLYKLRRMIYEFIKLSRSNNSCDEKLINIKNQIQLHYNIDEQADLIELLSKIIADKKDERLKEELIKYCQIAFKSEWEKVKKEAGEPILKSILKQVKSIRKSKWYEKPWICLCCIVILLLILLILQSKRLLAKRININFVYAKPFFTNLDGFNIVKDIIIPIILSIIAAIIFWFVFNYLPDRKRYTKIRPKVEYSMYSIYSKLFHYIDLILRHNAHSPSMFQHKIRGGMLQKEDIGLALQNKCLNDSYLFDQNSRLFIVIGNSLFDKSIRIDAEVERVFSFNNFLNTNEILLLEKIRTKLFTYEYKENADMKIGDQIYRCKNPNISYMANNIYDIYKLFLQLQDIIFSNKYSEREIMISLVQHYYYSNNYNLCKKQIDKNIEKYQDCKELLQCYDFLCDYMLNRKEKAYENIEKLFKDKMDLVSNRDFLKPIIKEGSIQELLRKYYTEADIEYLNNVIKAEESQKTNYINQAIALKKYYEK